MDLFSDLRKWRRKEGEIGTDRLIFTGSVDDIDLSDFIFEVSFGEQRCCYTGILSELEISRVEGWSPLCSRIFFVE